MKTEVELYDVKDRLPKVGENILYVRDDGMSESWRVGFVERSFYRTEFRKGLMTPQGYLFEVRSKETLKPINEDSYPYVDLGDRVTMNKGKYIVLDEEIEKLFDTQEFCDIVTENFRKLRR